MKLSRVYIVLLSISVCFPVLGFAAPSLTLELNSQQQNQIQVYRQHFTPPYGFYTPTAPNQKPSDNQPPELKPFTGWDFQWAWSGLNQGQTAPNVHLAITPDSNNPAQCQFMQLNNGLYNNTDPALGPTDNTKQETPMSMFAVGEDGHTLVANPFIPQWYTDTMKDHPTPEQITCKANVYGYYFDSNGEKVKSTNTIPVTMVFNPNKPYPNDSSHQVVITNNNLPSDFDSAITQVVVTATNYPVIYPAITYKGNTATYSFPSYVNNVNVTIHGGSNTVNNELYYAKISADNQTSYTSLKNIPISNDKLAVNADWTEIPANTSSNSKTNTYRTVSGGVETQNRFQYGTFQVTMKPSDHPGTNSSFYTFYANGEIPVSADGVCSLTSNINQQIFPFNSCPFMNFGYTWHEIDFEFTPGPHTQSIYPQFSPFDGTAEPYNSPDTISNGISLNAYFPGNVETGASGAISGGHWQYWPNPLTTTTKFNPYTSNNGTNTYSITWTPDQIKYYVNHQLVRTQKIKNQVAANTMVPASDSVFSNTNAQNSFNNSFAGKLKPGSTNEYIVHNTTPQHIAMNFWLPGTQGNFAGVFTPLVGKQQITDDYSEVQWSACVNTNGSIDPNCGTTSQSSNSRLVGKVFDAAGKPLQTDAKANYTWDFTSYNSKVDLFKNGWMLTPINSLGNTYFVQNNVNIVPKKGLELCMQNQWDTMANGSTLSTGCDGQMILPDPGQVTDDNFNKSLLVFHVVFANNTASQAEAKILADPKENYNAAAVNGILPVGADGNPLAVYNPGVWIYNQQNTVPSEYKGTGCDSTSSIGSQYCAGNGWYANPYLSLIDNTYQSYALVSVNSNTGGASPKPITNWQLKAFNSMMPNGKQCTVSYSENGKSITALSLKGQHTYHITATVNCE